MSIKDGKSLGEIIKSEMEEKGIKGAAVARKMNVARQTINQIDKRKRFDLEFLIAFKDASGLDYTQYAYEHFVTTSFNEPATPYNKETQYVTLTLNVSCNRKRVNEFSNFLEQMEDVARKFGYKII